MVIIFRNKIINDSKTIEPPIIEHVVGDGNCFFHSLSKSPFVSADPAELRYMLVDYIEAEMAKPGNEMEALYKIFGGDHDLHHWVATMKRELGRK